MPHGLVMGGALDGPLTRPLPIGNGLRARARLGVVVCDELGLCLGSLRELGLQYPGNTLMVLLSGASQQRLIGRFLDQGMLEEICRLRWEAPLVQELRLHQLVEPAVRAPLVPRGD